MLGTMAAMDWRSMPVVAGGLGLEALRALGLHGPIRGLKWALTPRLREALARPADGSAELTRRFHAQRLAPLETALRGADGLPQVRRGTASCLSR